jgi:hypothetical protein
VDSVTKAAIVAGAFGLSATLGVSAASAATANFNLGSSSAGPSGSLVFYDTLLSGKSLTVSATTGANYGSQAATTVQTWSGYGLGAGGEPTPYHAVDSKDGWERVSLKFSDTVKIESIEFYYVNSVAKFDYFVDTGTGLDQKYTQSISNGVYNFLTDGHADYASDLHALGASYAELCPVTTTFRRLSRTYCSDKFTKFKIKSITVSYDDTPVVPLPAGAVLMMTALGGLGFARKRKS